MDLIDLSRINDYSVCIPINEDQICQCSDKQKIKNPMRNINNKEHVCTIDNDCAISNVIAKFGGKKIDVDKKDKDKSKQVDESTLFLERRYKIIAKIANNVLEDLKTESMLGDSDLRSIVISCMVDLKVKLDESLINDVIVYIKAKANKQRSLCVDKQQLLNAINAMSVRPNSNLDAYQALVANTQHLSIGYENIYQSLSGSYKKFKISNTDMISPVIVALFGVRVPLLFDVAMNQDLYSLVKEDNQYYSDMRNNWLLKLKLQDNEPYQAPPAHMGSSSYSEINRVILSMVIKLIIIDMLQGKLYSEFSDEVAYLLSETDKSKYNTYEELLVDCIMKIWWVKPTHVYRPNSTERRSFVTYKLRKSLIDTKHGMSGYVNTHTNPSIYVPYNYNHVPMPVSGICTTNMCVQPMYQQNACIPTLIENFFTGHTEPISRSSPIFVLSIPRVGPNCINKMILKIDQTPVAVTDTITLLDGQMKLISAVCYEAQTTGCVTYYFPIALLRIDENNSWLKYNKTPFSKQTFEEYVDNIYKARENSDNSLLKTREDIAAEIKEKNFLPAEALIISEENAFSIIKTRGTLLIYAQQMENSTYNYVEEFDCY